jgi:hypothetical protein
MPALHRAAHGRDARSSSAFPSMALSSESDKALAARSRTAAASVVGSGQHPLSAATMLDWADCLSPARILCMSMICPFVVIPLRFNSRRDIDRSVNDSTVASSPSLGQNCGYTVFRYSSVGGTSSGCRKQRESPLLSWRKVRLRACSPFQTGCLQGRRLAGTVSDRCWQGCCVRGGAEAAGPVGQRPGRLMVSPG